MYLYWRIKQQAVPFLPIFVFNEKNRAHIDIYYNFYSTFATSKQAKNKGHYETNLF